MIAIPQKLRQFRRSQLERLPRRTPLTSEQLGTIMRKIIAAMITSLDGYIEGSKGQTDWISSWEDVFDLEQQIDTCILGAKMYPDYEKYWSAVHATPGAPLPFSSKPATQGEIDYANFAMRTPHIVLSAGMGSTGWKHTRIVRTLNDIRDLKLLPGKDMHAVGGAALVSSLLNEGLVDELRLVVVPILLGSGKSLFQGIHTRQALHMVSTTGLKGGLIRMTYAVNPTADS
jgi:dihydrofolate reductase